MAVEIKYVVVRKGDEKMTFASKKEADAYDKMLDMAEAFSEWLTQHQPELEESQAETLGLLLAEHKETVQTILRTSRLPDLKDASGQRDLPDNTAQDSAVDSAEKETGSAKKMRAVKAA